MKKKLPKSIRKFIRREKARIRREVLDLGKQKELINQLYRTPSRFIHKQCQKIKKLKSKKKK